MRMSIPFFVLNNVAKSLKELVFDPHDLATLFITKNSIDMRELSQLKRIAIINAISNCVCKGCPYRCYILKFNTLANLFE